MCHVGQASSGGPPVPGEQHCRAGSRYVKKRRREWECCERGKRKREKGFKLAPTHDSAILVKGERRGVAAPRISAPHYFSLALAQCRERQTYSSLIAAKWRDEMSRVCVFAHCCRSA